jgi:tyrosyl-tRNA synthetase
MSFTEFTYQLVQGYDFLHLYKNKIVRCKWRKWSVGKYNHWNWISPESLVEKRMRWLVRWLQKQMELSLENPKVIFGWILLELHYKFYQYWLNTSDIDAEKYIKILHFYQKKKSRF